MQDIVTVDIGGTNARFAIAKVDQGRVVELGEATTLRTADHASLALAWEAFGRAIDRELPRYAGIAIACPIQGETLKMTNNPWIIQPAMLAERLHLEDFTLVNDFGAVGHAVARSTISISSISAVLTALCPPRARLPSWGQVRALGLPVCCDARASIS